MESTNVGDLVTVAGSGPAIDGIVFDTPSRTKIVVAVVDAHRGPVFRSVHPDALSARTQAGSHDQALRLLIRRSPPPAAAKASGTGPGGRGSAGFARPATHRTTGR